MKKQILLIITFVCTLNILFSQNLRIEGYGNSQITGKTLRLIGIIDNLSGLEKELASVNIADTAFSFALTIDNSMPVKLRIETFEYNFIAQKGGHYQIHILPFNFSISDSVNTFFYKIPLPCEIISPVNDMNDEIFIADSIVDDYYFSNQPRLLIKKDKTAIKTIENTIDSLSGTFHSQYSKDFACYTLGEMKFATGIYDSERLRAELFFNKNILYDNIGYMSCLELVYKDYFTKSNRNISPSNLERWFITTDYKVLNDALGVDTLLKNEVFREIVFLFSMKNAFLNGDFDRKQIIKMLNTFETTTKFNEHKQICTNLIQTLQNYISKGKKSMEITLSDINNNEISMSKYRGKPLLLSFVKLNDPYCLRELNILYSLQSDLENIQLVTISCDKTMDALYNFLTQNHIGARYKWDFLWFSNHYELLEYYGVKFLPLFILLDSDGTISQNPLRKPSEGSLNNFIKKPG